MRINKLLARATGLSRRAADQAIREGRVSLNRRRAGLGDDVEARDEVTLDGRPVTANPLLTVMLHKPAGYVCSRRGQGSRTIYDLLLLEYQALKPVGRLDKASSGLLLLTNDGDLANRLTHPRYAKTKVYEVRLDKPLTGTDQAAIEKGLELDDGMSRLALRPLDRAGERWQVTMSEGRNRQIRRTFAAAGYEVKGLHRTAFGSYQLRELKAGQYRTVQP